MNKEFLKVAGIAIGVIGVGVFAYAGATNKPTDHALSPEEPVMFYDEEEIHADEDTDSTFVDAPTGGSTKNTYTQGGIEEIKILLETEEWVDVIVSLNVDDEFLNDDQLMAEVRRAQDKVLATLAKSDFELSGRLTYTPAFAGYVSKSGVEKLLKNPLVSAVSINGRSFPAQTSY